MRLGKIIKYYRAMNDMTQRQLAKEIGTGYATICRIERGHAIDALTLLRVKNWMCAASLVAPKPASEYGEPK